MWRKSRAGWKNEEASEEIIQARTDSDLGLGGGREETQIPELL